MQMALTSRRYRLTSQIIALIINNSAFYIYVLSAILAVNIDFCLNNINHYIFPMAKCGFFVLSSLNELTDVIFH